MGERKQSGLIQGDSQAPALTLTLSYLMALGESLVPCSPKRRAKSTFIKVDLKIYWARIPTGRKGDLNDLRSDHAKAGFEGSVQ